ncbi:NAD(P)H-dependent oxidoreductase [symbiont of Argiope bruennichi]|uniref:NAD(P)H-dependent oxidoreductase n=1 Tax=symbiont of Argiope bruennichi TaxID=2810479 RepID=UPI003DA4F2F5
MKIFYIFCHPSNKNSFNHALFKVAKSCLEKNHSVIFKDLYEENFDPVLDFNKIDNSIDSDIKNVIWADIVILQFPVWWFSVPAILKGWIDKVLKEGVAYDNDHKFDNGFWNDKNFFYICTAGGQKENYDLPGRISLESLLFHIDLAFSFCGLKPLKNFIIYDLYHMTQNRSWKIFASLENKLTSL